MRVRVYYNIRKKCLSVMDKSTRRVIKHTQGISLSNVKFIVSKKGVERIRARKRKAVVAFVEGNVAAWHANPDCPTCKAQRHAGIVSFNPYKWDTFVFKQTGIQIDSCDYATIDGGIIRAYETDYSVIDGKKWDTTS